MGNRLIILNTSVDDDKRSVVDFLYRKETDFFHKKIHKRGGTVDENIEDTLSTISDTSKMYVIRVLNEICAFFGVYTCGSGKVLEGFHVAKEYRNKYFLKEFWDKVNEVMNGEYLTGIYATNKPAIKHLYRNGFILQNVSEVDGKKILILKLKKNK